MTGDTYAKNIGTRQITTFYYVSSEICQKYRHKINDEERCGVYNKKRVCKIHTKKARVEFLEFRRRVPENLQFSGIVLVNLNFMK